MVFYSQNTNLSFAYATQPLAKKEEIFSIVFCAIMKHLSIKSFPRRTPFCGLRVSRMVHLILAGGWIKSWREIRAERSLELGAGYSQDELGPLDMSEL